jgi:hypothetical protein
MTICANMTARQIVGAVPSRMRGNLTYGCTTRSIGASKSKPESGMFNEAWTIGGYHRGGSLKIMCGSEMVAEVPNIPEQDAIAQFIVSAASLNALNKTPKKG